MNQRIEHLFRLREAFQLEVDPVVKKQLRDRLFADASAFLKDNGIEMSEWQFISATRGIYKNWKNNPH